MGLEITIGNLDKKVCGPSPSLRIVILSVTDPRSTQGEEKGCCHPCEGGVHPDWILPTLRDGKGKRGAFFDGAANLCNFIL